MELLSKRDKISGVAAAWKAQYYGRDGQWREIWKARFAPEEIYNNLVALGSDTTEDSIKLIIGNDVWTRLQCEECGDSVDLLIRFGDKMVADYFDVCPHCLSKALAKVRNSEHTPNFSP